MGQSKGYSCSNRDERTQWKEEFDVSCMHHNGGVDSGWRDLDRWPDHARSEEAPRKDWR